MPAALCILCITRQPCEEGGDVRIYLTDEKKLEQL